MDELVNAVLLELAFDGPEGASRAQLDEHLRSAVDRQSPAAASLSSSSRADRGRTVRHDHDGDVVNDEDVPTDASQQPQLVDDTFQEFFWGRLRRRRGVSVGAVPSPTGRGVAADVNGKPIVVKQEDGDRAPPPPPSPSSAGKIRRERVAAAAAAAAASSPPSAVAVDPRAKALSLEELSAHFGDRLRFVADEEVRKRLLSGQKLSDAAWLVLQVITRSRQAGVPFPVICAQTGLDAKGVFYQVNNVLGQRRLVVRFKANYAGGVANIAIASRFAHLSPAYRGHARAQRGADAAAASSLNDDDDGAEVDDDDGGDDEAAPGDPERASDVHEVTTEANGLVRLAEVPEQLVLTNEFVKLRMLHLLRHSHKNITPRSDLVYRMGFGSLGRTRRKAANPCASALVAEGLVELVTVHLPTERDAEHTEYCYRLTDAGRARLEAREGEGGASSIDSRREARLKSQLERSRPGALVGEVGWERQIAEMVARAGTVGVVYEDIVKAFHLSPYGVRHVDNAVTNMATGGSAAAYADVDLCAELEQDGRRRHQRLLTRRAYVARGLARPELGLGGESLARVPRDAAALWGFSDTPLESARWRALEGLLARVNWLWETQQLARAGSGPGGGASAAGGGGGGGGGKRAELDGSTSARANKRPRVNPIDPTTGRPKKGRPKKADSLGGGGGRGRKKAVVAAQATDAPAATTAPTTEATAAAAVAAAAATTTSAATEDGEAGVARADRTTEKPPSSVPKKRGRPRRTLQPGAESSDVEAPGVRAAATAPAADATDAADAESTPRTTAVAAGDDAAEPRGPVPPLAGAPEEPPRRKRGRPRKHPLPEPPADVVKAEDVLATPERATPAEDQRKGGGGATHVEPGSTSRGSRSSARRAAVSSSSVGGTPAPPDGAVVGADRAAAAEAQAAEGEPTQTGRVELRSSRRATRATRTGAHGVEVASAVQAADGRTGRSGEVGRGLASAPSEDARVAQTAAEAALGDDDGGRRGGSGVVGQETLVGLEAQEAGRADGRASTVGPPRRDEPRQSAAHGTAHDAAERGEQAEFEAGRRRDVWSAADVPAQASAPQAPASGEATASKSVTKPATPRINTSLRKRAMLLKEFIERHGACEMVDMARRFRGFVAEKEGEEAAAVHTLSDVRTRGIVLNLAMSMADIRTTKMTVPPPPGSLARETRQVVIVYDGGIDDAELQRYCSKVLAGEEAGRPRPVRKEPDAPVRALGRIDIGLKAGEQLRRNHKGSALLEDFERRPLAELLTDATRATLLGKPNVFRQHVGVPRGQLRRYQALHEELLNAVLVARAQDVAEKDAGHSPAVAGVIDAQEGLVDVRALALSLPLRRTVAFTDPAPCMEVVNAIEDPAMAGRAVAELSSAIRTACDVSETRISPRLELAIQSLEALGLVERLEERDASGHWRIAQPDSRQVAVARVRTEDVAQLGLDSAGRPQIADPALAMRTPGDLTHYWRRLAGQPRPQNGRAPKRAVSDGPSEAHLHVLALLTNRRSWHDHRNYLIDPNQTALIRRVWKEVGRDDEERWADLDFVRDVLRACVAPAWAVVKLLEGDGAYFDEDHPIRSLMPAALARKADPESRARARTGAPSRREAKRREAERRGATQSLQSVKRKAKAAAAARKARWDTMLARVAAECRLGEEHLRAADKALYPIRRAFIRHAEAMSEFELERQLASAARRAVNPLSARAISSTNASAAKTRRRRRWAEVQGAKREDGRSEGAGRGEEGSGLGTARARRSGPLRRVAKPRVVWSREKEELLRDACVILTARDKERGGAKNWTALRQLFPDVTTTVCRLHYASLRQRMGEAAYLDALEEEWTPLWRRWRGTIDLRDDDWYSATEFRLAEHIQFLRDRIDKDAILEKIEGSNVEPLSADVAALAEEWQVEDQRDLDPATIFAPIFANEYEASLSVKSGLLHGHALSASVCFPPTPSDGAAEPASARLEDAIKMELSAAQQPSMHDQLRVFESQFNVDDLKRAAARLERQQVLRSDAQLPSEGERGELVCARLCATERRARAFEEAGLILKSELIRDAETARLRIVAELDEQEGDEGHGALLVDPDRPEADTAALIEMLSRGEMKPRMHLSGIDRLKQTLFFNAKQLEDRHVEMAIDFQRGPSWRVGQTEDRRFVPPAIPGVLSWLDGDGKGSEIASRVARAWEALKRRHGAPCAVLYESLRRAGQRGCTVDQVQEMLQAHVADEKERDEIVRAVVGGDRPVAFRAGYDVARLVSATCLPAWTVRSAQLGGGVGAESGAHGGARLGAHVLPRCWLSVSGDVEESAWQRGVQLVEAWARNRPGITRASLLTFLSPNFDRVEVCDLVAGAAACGRVRVRVRVAAAHADAAHRAEEGLRVVGPRRRRGGGGVRARRDQDDDDDDVLARDDETCLVLA